MTLKEMVDSALSEVLDDYMSQNGVKTGDTTLEQTLEWAKLTRGMSELMAEITEQNKVKVKKIELPMPYVLTMLDALQAIKKHKLYSLMGDAKDTEEYIDVVIEEFLEPIANSESTDEIEIVFYD